MGRDDNLSPLGPEKLIRRFCKPAATGLAAESDTATDGSKTVSQGWCGYIGGNGDPMLVGFQDGYEFMGYLADRGWIGVHDKGNWPYVIYLVWRHQGEVAIIEYCEGDLTLWQFADLAEATTFADTLS